MNRKEIKDKEYQLAFQKMILDISFDFIKIDENNYDKKAQHLLEKLGKFVQADRTYLLMIDKNSKLTCSYEWCSENFDSIKDKEVDLKEFPWLKEQLERNQSVYHIEDINKLPEEANREQLYFKNLNIQSTISVPLEIKDEFHGFIGIDSINSAQKWAKEDTELLKKLAKIVSSGINQMNAAKKINFMAYHDQLTSLPNQQLLDDRINDAVLQAKSGENLLSLLFIDLDEFKEINDSLGHQQGDALLKQFSKRLLKIVSEKDTVSRMGGDEFAILLADYQNENQLDQILSKIIAIFKEPFILNDQEKFITGSIGISEYPKDGDRPSSLIRNADMAMYHAKNLGKNQYQKMTKELKETINKTVTLTNDLYQAIEREEFEVFYQPVVKGKTAEIVGLEALLRWRHPRYGYVSPVEFIPLAEQTHLIHSIGCWVRETVAKQIEKWNQKAYKSFNVAVNFSVYELNHPSLKNNLETLIKKHSLDPEYMEIEITESLYLNHFSSTLQRLKEIEELGITLTIDDYGKGYSSLSRLRELPIKKMKIDKVFIDGIGRSYKDEVIVEGLLSFAESLDLEIVAEGVETKEQLDFLNKYNCDQIQGYYFYKPMPADEVEKLLTLK